MNTAFWICFVVVFIAVAIVLVATGEASVAKTKLETLEHKYKLEKERKPKEVQVPVEKEVIKYVDRIIEKEVKVPVEKEVVKYVDRIVEKEVERVINPTLEEKERIIQEGQEAAENLIAEAKQKADKIVSASKTVYENECKSMIRKAEKEANRIKEEAENEIRQHKEKVLAGEERNKKREEILEHWSSELQRKESYNLTRSENHRKETLRLKHEAQDIRNDMLKQGSDYLAELRDRVGRLMEVIQIEDESLLDTISQELADKKKLHKQKIKKEAETFAEANFHDLPYDSMKICMLAVYYCDLLADKLIGNIHRTGVDNALEKVRQAIETTEALFPPSVKFRISDAYIQSKKEQIQLAFEIETYKKEQKEIRRQQLEAAREEIKAQKELEQERKKAEKDEMEAQAAIERNRFEMAQAKTQAEMDKFREQIARLEDALKQAQERRERALSMAQQTKCGYVYIISNIGSFGDGVYKIGMTRRVEPMERVAELGDASVPFPFDVHAMIYTEDAPGLEASLHRTFDDRKVNAVNGRKEFFRVPLSEIKQQVEQYGIACDWVDKPSACQYRDSIHLRE